MAHLSNILRSFNRFELKYLVSLRQAEAIKQSLRAYLLPDEHGGGSYDLSSLYYDSPDLRFFWEKMDGIRFRRKLRIRHYEDGRPFGEDTPVFVEVKQRVDRVTQKRRALLPYGQALRLCDRKEVPEHEAQDASVVDEVASMLWEYNLRPVSVVRYRRQAFVGTEHDPGLRVTFDTALHFRTADLLLHSQASTLPMLRPDRTVMEIKVNERMPTWLTSLVAAQELNLVRMSKYCRSIELASNLPSSHWRAEVR